MTDRFMRKAENAVGVVEEFLNNLPGVSGYMDKEARRDADRRVRTQLATQLENQKQNLFDIQKRLLSNGGLRFLDEVDQGIQKLQILIDRVKTASYGYAGFFDTVKIQEAELDALHNFDLEMVQSAAGLDYAIHNLSNATSGRDEGLKSAIQSLIDQIVALNQQFDQRQRVIEDDKVKG